MLTRRVNKNWFVRKLSENRRSMRELAKHMRLDVSALSRMFSGKRRMQITEAGKIAKFLDVPLSKVLRHAGMPTSIEAGEPKVLLAASVNEAGRVEKLIPSKSLPKPVIAHARSMLMMYSGSDIIAAQIKASTGALALFDDAIVLFREGDGVEPSAIDSLSICSSYGGEQMLCKVERARKTGEARVVLAGGEVRELILDSATPVLAIIP